MIIPPNYETPPYHDPQKVLDDCIRWQQGDLSAQVPYYMVYEVFDVKSETDLSALEDLDLWTFVQICKAHCYTELTRGAFVPSGLSTELPAKDSLYGHCP